jgi:hypothetical protein
MGALVDLGGAVRDNAGYVTVPATVLKPGCKGPACPAFALCQGRHGTDTTRRLAAGGLALPAAAHPTN